MQRIFFNLFIERPPKDGNKTFTQTPSPTEKVYHTWRQKRVKLTDS